ncbi:MAG: DivIVA domain-containing protein [Ilumatobacter sp.]|nr:DivIVA domain-containing protein [Ilumatobacter sp.]
MAASLSRPDPSSPASVAEAGFSTTRRGYSQDEVRAFLTSVAAELGRLQERERQLEAQLETTKRDVDAPVAPELDEEMVAALVGEETLRVLQTARESASQIKIRAEESAAQVLREANDDANRLRQDAEVEAARKRHDATSDAEAEVALAKQQGREMVTEARAYRERVLADLERRTKLARQQIDDLVHGRDRLLQVFERARLVAVDVTSELQSIDGPEEFVNFTPTTGPLPVMVPADQLDRDGEPVDAEDEIDRDAVDDPVDEGLDVGASDDPSATEEIAAVEEPDADTDTTADADAPAGDSDVDTDADDGDADTTSTARDANVVSLFRGRAAEAPTTADEGDADADASDEEASGRNDVDDLFERLRSEAPSDSSDDAGDATDGASDDADDDDVDADDDTVVTAEETAFSRRDAALVPLIVGGARRLKRVLADEQNGVLDHLRQDDPVTELDSVVATADEHIAVYVDALADDLLEAAVAGAVAAGRNDTKTLRTSLRKGGALDRARGVVDDDLVAPLRSRLERAIAEGGGDNDDVTKRVRAVYREWKTQHIDDQLDDVFRFAYGDGVVAGVKPGTPLTWTIDTDSSTCPDCEDNSLAGAVAAGEPFPTGHTAAPAHPGCRCLTVPDDQ